MVQPSEDDKIFGYPDLEGDWQGYTFRVYASLNAIGGNIYDVAINNQGTVYGNSEAGRQRSASVDINGNVTDLTPLHFAVPFGPWCFSIGKRYVVGRDFFANTFGIVCRDGQQIWIRDTSLDYANCTAIREWGISPNGKYLVFNITDLATGLSDAVLIYEGY